MSTVGQREIRTQRRVVAFFCDALSYTCLGNWRERPNNRNIESDLLTGWLKRQGHNDGVITKVLRELDKAAGLGGSTSLYDANRYDEAAGDGVVLDLRYEARNTDQHVTSQTRIDQWFESKTRGLTDVAKAQLKQRWGTMQKVLSAQDRLKQIVADIQLDMETHDRLKSGRGNALLVSDSIYSACRFFALFQQTELAGKCTIVTSYKPAPADIKGEESGEGLTEKLRRYDIYRKMLAAHFDEPEDMAMRKVEQFEKEVKKRFVKEPGRMKLLIVVDKLLTALTRRRQPICISTPRSSSWPSRPADRRAGTILSPFTAVPCVRCMTT